MRISQLSARAGIAPSAVRFYEDEGVLPEPPRTPDGYRDYQEDAVARLTFIRQAQAAGLRLDQIREVLAIRDGGHAPCVHVVKLLQGRLKQVRQQLAELEALREQLEHLLSVAADDPAAGNTEDDICWIIERAGDRPG